MKKTFSCFLCIVLIVTCFALAGCGSKKETADLSGSRYLGTWVISSLSIMGESESVTESDDLSKVTLTLLEDGTGHMDSPDEVSSFTWEEVDGGFRTSGDVRMNFKDEGDGIVGKVIGVELHFVKK